VKIEADSNDITERPRDDKPREYLCLVCDKRFTKKGHLDDHKLTHTREMLYPCTQCEKRFSNYRTLKQHMNVHSSKYECTECGKCFSGSEKLTEHRRSHSGEKPFECFVCSKRFTRSGNLLVHSRTHSGEKLYKCHLCDKAFTRIGYLKTHMSVHMGDKPYKCSMCDKSFDGSSTLQLHKDHVHSNRRPYDCRYCGKLFKTSDKLKRHVHIHTGAKPHSSTHHSDTFTQHTQLKTHPLKSHNEGTWFTCHICQKKVATVFTLRHAHTNTISLPHPILPHAFSSSPFLPLYLSVCHCLTPAFLSFPFPFRTLSLLHPYLLQPFSSFHFSHPHLGALVMSTDMLWQLNIVLKNASYYYYSSLHHHILPPITSPHSWRVHPLIQMVRLWSAVSSRSGPARPPSDLWCILS